MKKNFLKSTFVVAIMAASATIGYMAYNQHQNQQLAFANPLLEENIEALAHDPEAPGSVPNGSVMQIIPYKSKTCYRNCVDTSKSIIERHYDKETNTYYEVTLYRHYYKTYVKEECAVIPIAQASPWLKYCDTPANAECDNGDTDIKPEKMEYYA